MDVKLRNTNPISHYWLPLATALASASLMVILATTSSHPQHAVIHPSLTHAHHAPLNVVPPKPPSTMRPATSVQSSTSMGTAAIPEASSHSTGHLSFQVPTSLAAAAAGLLLTTAFCIFKFLPLLRKPHSFPSLMVMASSSGSSNSETASPSESSRATNLNSEHKVDASMGYTAPFMGGSASKQQQPATKQGKSKGDEWQDEESWQDWDPSSTDSSKWQGWDGAGWETKKGSAKAEKSDKAKGKKKPKEEESDEEEEDWDEEDEDEEDWDEEEEDELDEDEEEEYEEDEDEEDWDDSDEESDDAEDDEFNEGEDEFDEEEETEEDSDDDHQTPEDRAARKLARQEAWKAQQGQHVGRSVSVGRVTPEERMQWTKVVRRFAQKWDRPAPFIHKRYSFEGEGLKEIHKNSFTYNVLLEVRDVRVPDSSHHPSFQRLARHRLHLIYYTHADLIDKETRDRVEKWTKESWPKAKCLFLDTRETRGDFEPFERAYDILMDSLMEKSNNCALTVGIPNVGKSSLLLALMRGSGRYRNRPKPQIRDVPGFTKKVNQYTLRLKPKAFCMDVPGITPPPDFLLEKPERWYALVACNLLALPSKPDPEVIRMICAYILWACNRDRQFTYVKQLGLKGPTNDIDECLERLKTPMNFIKLFQRGSLGPVILDDIRVRHRDFVFHDWDDNERSVQYNVRHWGAEDEMTEADYNQWMREGVGPSRSPGGKGGKGKGGKGKGGKGKGGKGGRGFIQGLGGKGRGKGGGKGGGRGGGQRFNDNDGDDYDEDQRSPQRVGSGGRGGWGDDDDKAPWE